MQNKPNLQNALINVTSAITKDYGNAHLCEREENKPNQTQSNPISSPLNHADFSSKTSFTKLILHSKFYILNSLLYCSPVYCSTLSGRRPAAPNLSCVAFLPALPALSVLPALSEVEGSIVEGSVAQRSRREQSRTVEPIWRLNNTIKKQLFDIAGHDKYHVQ